MVSKNRNNPNLWLSIFLGSVRFFGANMRLLLFRASDSTCVDFEQNTCIRGQNGHKIGNVHAQKADINIF